MHNTAAMSDGTPHTPESQRLQEYPRLLSTPGIIAANTTPIKQQDDSLSAKDNNHKANPNNHPDEVSPSPSRRRSHGSPRNSKHWSRHEKSSLAVHLNNIRREDQIRGDAVLEEASRRMLADGYDRTPSSLANMQNRLGLRKERRGTPKKRLSNGKFIHLIVTSKC